MRRLLSVFSWYALLLGMTCYADGVSTEDSVVFAQIIECLKRYNSRASVQKAKELLEGIMYNYNRAGIPSQSEINSKSAHHRLSW